MAGVPNGFEYEVRGGAAAALIGGSAAALIRRWPGARAEKCRAAERLSARGRS